MVLFLVISLVAIACGAELVVPVTNVAEVRDRGARRYPARVVSVAEVAIKPQVTGEILELGFANGERVEKGRVLYRIDPVQYKAADANARARVDELKANLEYAEKSVTRHEELVKTRAVSQDDLDKAMSTRDAMRSSLAAAEASLAAAADDLRHCTIVSPIDGKAGSTSRTEGNYVMKGGETLVTVVSTDPVRVRMPVPNADYAAIFGSDSRRIVADAQVEVRLSSRSEACMTGRVEYVENSADALTDTVGVYALLANPSGALLAGQTVVATLSNSKGVVRAGIPPNAINQDIVGPFVWVLDAEGVASGRRIVRGRMQDGLQIVVDGLKPGERIVADGVHRVTEGAKVVAE